MGRFRLRGGASKSTTRPEIRQQGLRFVMQGLGVAEISSNNYAPLIQPYKHNVRSGDMSRMFGGGCRQALTLGRLCAGCDLDVGLKLWGTSNGIQTFRE